MPVGKRLSDIDSSACLLRAKEAERRAAEASAPDLRASWTDLAEHWRDLAEAARRQEAEPSQRPRR